MWYVGLDWADTHVRYVTAHDIPVTGQHWRGMLEVMELTSSRSGNGNRSMFQKRLRAKAL
jgi:hypothetical protein